MAEQAAPQAPANTTPTIPYPGKFDISDFEKRAGISFNLLGELMSQLTALDAFENMLAARNDPTVPALLNSALGNYVNFQNTGGGNVNDFLSGNYSSGQNQLQKMSIGGDPNDPFNVPLQRPGGNSMTSQLFKGLIGPVGVDQLAQYAQGLFGFYSPIPSMIPQTNRPLPNVVSPTFGGIGQYATGGGPNVPAPQAPAPATPMTQSQGAPVFSLSGPRVLNPQPVNMPAYQQGTPYVPQTGPAMLHQGEAVIPSAMNPINAAPPGVMQKPPPGFGMTEMFGGANTSMPAPGPRPMAPNPMLQTGMPQPFDIHTGQPGLPPEGPIMPPPGQPAQMNPLQQALATMQQLMMSGGPLNQQFQNTQGAMLADQVSLGQQQQLENMRANFGARGLGGSGLQYGLERDIGNNALSALTQGQNQIAMDAARTNYGATGDMASRLTQGALGAGQFGLQQQAQQQQIAMSLLDQLMGLIRQSHVNPSDQLANQTTVAFA